MTTAPATLLAQNWHDVRQQLETCAAQYETSTPRLLAVSKRHPASAIRNLHALGQRDFGENYVQEALDKQAELKDLDCVWHFIGPIQSNKTRQIAAHFDWVHSVDRLKIAERLAQQRPSTCAPLNICIQVNIDAEESKSGISADKALALADAIVQLPRLRLRGLMAIPAPQAELARQRQPLAALASLAAKIKAELSQRHELLPEPVMDTLSMGMSADLEAAVAEGATWVRVGTALFGQRE